MDPSRSRFGGLFARARRTERREVGAFREWLERTSNLLHVSMLIVVPLLIAAITYVANATNVLPFLLFPPLASGTYALFAAPGERYASPRRFVGGMTVGALCGWLSLVGFARFWYRVPPEAFRVHAAAAAFGIALTGVVAWGLRVEHPSAFSTALLVLVSGSELAYVLSVAVSTTLVAGAYVTWHRFFYTQRGEYLYRSTKGDDHVLVPLRGEEPTATTLLGARLAAAHEAGKVVLLDVVDDRAVANAERELLENGKRESATSVATDGGPDAIARDDEHAGNTESAGSAENTENAKSVENAERTGSDRKSTNGENAADDTPTPDAIEAAVVESIDGTTDGADGIDDGDRSPRERAEGRVATEAATQLEECAARIEREVGVPCEVVVAVGGTDHGRTMLDTARTENCDLIVTGYERTTKGENNGEGDGDGGEGSERSGDSLPAFVRTLFRGDIDTVIHRPTDGRTDWRRVLVPIRGASAVSHTMLDFAERLADGDRRSIGRSDDDADDTGDVAVCHCIDDDGDRRAAERMLADLVETCGRAIETRVARAPINDFLAARAPEYDLVIVGASTDRSAASRFLSPPTFSKLDDVDCDVAIVHR